MIEFAFGGSSKRLNGAALLQLEGAAIGKTSDGERRLWHSGGVFGMSSQLILLPASQQAYVLLANDACMNTQSQLEAMAMTIRSTGPTPAS